MGVIVETLGGKKGKLHIIIDHFMFSFEIQFCLVYIYVCVSV